MAGSLVTVVFRLECYCVLKSLSSFSVKIEIVEKNHVKQSSANERRKGRGRSLLPGSVLQPYDCQHSYSDHAVLPVSELRV
jgi:hypothetical protein